MTITKRNIKRLLLFVIVYHVAWLAFFKIPTMRELRARSTSDNLVVYNALGRQQNLTLVEHSRRNIFKPDEWDCVAFMFGKGDRIPDDDEHLVVLRDELGCSISRTPSSITWDWGTFLQYISPTFVSNYDYIALVLDDVFIPDRGSRAVNPNKLIKDMKTHNIDVMSPSIMGYSHGLRQVALDESVDGCLMEVDMLETFVQLFTRDAWECYFNMLHFTGGKGWCYDLCFQSQCPDFRMAQDFSMRAMHMDKWVVELNFELPKGEVIGTNLTDWKPKPKVAENEYLEKANMKVCEELGCDRRISKELRAISCPFPEAKGGDSASKPEHPAPQIDDSASKPDSAPQPKPKPTVPKIDNSSSKPKHPVMNPAPKQRSPMKPSPGLKDRKVDAAEK